MRFEAEERMHLALTGEIKLHGYPASTAMRVMYADAFFQQRFVAERSTSD